MTSPCRIAGVNPAVAATARESAEGTVPEAKGTVPEAEGRVPEWAEGTAPESAWTTAPPGAEPLAGVRPLASVRLLATGIGPSMGTASSCSTIPWTTGGVIARTGRPNLIAIVRHP